ncbi:MAG: restriction endonuclease subunit S [Methylococcales bacterium]
MSEVVTKELPEGWERVPLKDAVHIILGQSPSSSTYNQEGEGLPFFQGKTEFGKMYPTVRKWCTEPKKIAEQEDVLVSVRAPVGPTNLAPYECAIGRGLAALRPLGGSDSKYFLYLIRRYQNNLAALGTGTTFEAISGDTLKNFLVPIAPLEQQKRIVAKIEELFFHIDAGIEALKKAKQLLKQYRQSVLKAAVTGELTKEWREANKDKLEPASQLLERILAERENEYTRKLEKWEKGLAGWSNNGEKGKKPSKPQKIKVLDEISHSSNTSLWSIPENWSWIKLGNLAVDVFDGPFGSNLKSNDYVEDGVRVIRLENIGCLVFKDKKVTYITEKKYETLKKHTVSAGDIIFSSFVAVGTRVVVLPDNIVKAINKADCFCVRAFGDSINATYLANFLSTTSTYKRLENQVHGATRPRINTTQLKELEVPICSDLEQMEIVCLTGEKFEAIARLEKEIDYQLIKAEKNKQSVLASAFQGKITNG